MVEKIIPKVKPHGFNHMQMNADGEDLRRRVDSPAIQQQYAEEREQRMNQDPNAFNGQDGQIHEQVIANDSSHPSCNSNTDEALEFTNI